MLSTLAGRADKILLKVCFSHPQFVHPLVQEFLLFYRDCEGDHRIVFSRLVCGNIQLSCQGCKPAFFEAKLVSFIMVC